MREIRQYGSVRGVVGDPYPYRDPQFLIGPNPGGAAPSVAGRETPLRQGWQECSPGQGA